MNHEQAIAKFRDGQGFFYGRSRRKNYRKAFVRLLAAAGCGILPAQRLVGYCFSEGVGTAKDERQGFLWFQRAARNRSARFWKAANQAIVFCNLAMMYDQGAGTARNPILAVKSYRRSAQMGDSIAQCNLGCLLADGDGTRCDPVQAVQWWRRSARQGDDKAQFNLANAYLAGSGVAKQSRRLALLWLAKAAAQGHRRAASMLRRLEQ